MNKELKAAMVIAYYTRPETSLVEGAQRVLDHIYSEHEKTSDNELCNRCGKNH